MATMVMFHEAPLAVNGKRWIVPLRVLAARGKLKLLVPSLVRDEFERNRKSAASSLDAGDGPVWP